MLKNIKSHIACANASIAASINVVGGGDTIDYNNAPMMSIEDYNQCDYLNLNKVTLKKLKEYENTDTVFWLTPIRSYGWDNRICGNEILPCKLLHLHRKWWVDGLWTNTARKLVHNENYVYEEELFSLLYNRNKKGIYELPKHLIVSTSYEYVNRYRYEQEKILKTLKPEIQTFSMDEAKIALSEKHNIPFSYIGIK